MLVSPRVADFRGGMYGILGVVHVKVASRDLTCLNWQRRAQMIKIDLAIRPV